MYPILSMPDTVVIHAQRKPRNHAVHLARLDASGALHLLSGDWEAVLGWTCEELEGRALEDILAGGPAACRDVLARLVDRELPDPIGVTLWIKGGGTRELQVHRRFDDYAGSVWLACEPLGLEAAISRFRSRSSAARSG